MTLTTYLIFKGQEEDGVEGLGKQK
jgi:hypothetical protein